MTALQSDNMQHAFPVARHLCATVLQDEVQIRRKKKKREKRRRGGSRDILTSSLVPINSLTTHASCSAQACGKVTQTKEALSKRKWSDQCKQYSYRTDREKKQTMIWFHFSKYGCWGEYVFKAPLMREQYGRHKLSRLNLALEVLLQGGFLHSFHIINTFW